MRSISLQNKQISIGQVSEPLWDCRYLSMGKKNKGKQKAKKIKMTEALNSGRQNPEIRGSKDGAGQVSELTDKQKSRLSDYCLFAGCLYIGSSLLLFLFFWLFGIYMLDIAATVLMIAGISDFVQRRKKKFRQSLYRQCVNDIVIFALVLVMLAYPSNIQSRNVKKYSGYKFYLNGVLDTEDLFPYELPKSMHFLSYKIINKNKAWGMSSWSSVRFRVDTDSAEWEKMVYEKYTNREKTYEGTHYEGTLEECLNGNSKSENLRFLCDRGFWEGYEKNSFVMSDLNTGTDKKPVSKIIIINPKEGMIEFSQLNKPFLTILP